MKKTVSLFQRNYDGDRLVRDEVVPGAEWVANGEGVATRKHDGTCCLVRDGKLFKRYDAKAGKQPPANFEPAQEAVYYCVTCLCAVQYPFLIEGGIEDVTQECGREASISECVLRQTHTRPGISQEPKQVSEQTSDSLRTMQDGVHGQEGEAVLRSELRSEMAMVERGEAWRHTILDGTSRSTGKGTIGSEEITGDESRLCVGVGTRSSESIVKQGIYPRTPYSCGGVSGEGAGAMGTCSPQKRNQGGQPTGEFGNSDPRDASGYGYLSTLPEGIRDALIVGRAKCGALLTHCIPPDKNTGHWPGWVPVGDGPDDVRHREAWEQPRQGDEGTYELCGPKVQGNPEGFDRHVLIKHGCEVLHDCQRTFDALREYLSDGAIEGVVWHHPDGRMVKIKGKDFGIKRKPANDQAQRLTANNPKA